MQPKKRLALGIGSFLVLCLVLGAASVNAGGCCYKSFSAEPGIAGKQDAKIKVSFVDPRNVYADPGKTTLSSLSDAKIQIHVQRPKSGQSCEVLSERTDGDGTILARCSSAVPGQLSVYFSAPELDAESNQMIGQVSQQIMFAGTAAVVETPVSVSVEPPKDLPEVTSSSFPAQEEEQLQQRVVELEKQVEEQKQEVGFLRALVNRLLAAFGLIDL